MPRNHGSANGTSKMNVFGVGWDEPVLESGMVTSKVRRRQDCGQGSLQMHRQAFSAVPMVPTY